MDIHSRVKKMIRSVFEAAAKVHPEMHSPTSRAMYGVDVMLDTNFQPKLLEVCMLSCPSLLVSTTILLKNVLQIEDSYLLMICCLFCR